jgi:shikimate kinase
VARLVLVGLPGTGKTTVARELASRWDVAAIDTDDALAVAVGRSVPDFLREVGDDEFRQREYEVLLEVLASDAVVATGGGSVTLAPARACLVGEKTYWLDCADEEIVTRVARGDRPLLGDDPKASIARLRAQREPWYREVARVRIDASGSLDEVVNHVLDEVKGEDE